jgi:hypothetical protein
MLNFVCTECFSDKKLKEIIIEDSEIGGFEMQTYALV